RAAQDAAEDRLRDGIHGGGRRGGGDDRVGRVARGAAHDARGQRLLRHPRARAGRIPRQRRRGVVAGLPHRRRRGLPRRYDRNPIGERRRSSRQRRGMMKRLVCLLVFLVAGAAWAQRPAQLKQLDPFAGSWSCKGTVYAGEWGPEHPITMTVDSSWAYGGEWVQPP